MGTVVIKINLLAKKLKRNRKILKLIIFSSNVSFSGDIMVSPEPLGLIVDHWPFIINLLLGPGQQFY